MKSKINQELLEFVMAEKIRDVDRYYQSLQYVLGLKYYFKNNGDLKTKFIGAEVVLKRITGDELKPDACLQTNKDTKGILGIPIEIKSSLSDEDDVFNQLKQMERYNDALSGWDSKNGVVDDEVMVFSPYLDDAGRTLRILKKSLKENKLKYTKEFLLWQWSLVPSLKHPNQENLLVQQVFGDLSSKEVSKFDIRICDGIKQDINDINLVIEKERDLFTNQEPPVEYIMIVLWEHVFGRFLNESNNIISTDKVVELINNYYTESLMKNPGNKEYKFKTAWAEKALKMFVNINMAKIIGNNFELKLNCNQRNIRNYFCERVSLYEIRKGFHLNKLNQNKTKNLKEFEHKDKELFEDEN